MVFLHLFGEKGKSTKYYLDELAFTLFKALQNQMGNEKKLKFALLANLLLLNFMPLIYGQKSTKAGSQSILNVGITEREVAALSQKDADGTLITETNGNIDEKLRTSKPIFTDSKVQGEESDHINVYNGGNDIPDSFKTTFYFFFGISTAAVLFILVKVYRMRLSRAERKYGVQGDRTSQELTPLPISIEDGNSDEEDQTLFEINRQQIRIL